MYSEVGFVNQSLQPKTTVAQGRVKQISITALVQYMGFCPTKLFRIFLISPVWPVVMCVCVFSSVQLYQPCRFLYHHHNSNTSFTTTKNSFITTPPSLPSLPPQPLATTSPFSSCHFKNVVETEPCSMEPFRTVSFHDIIYLEIHASCDVY